MIFSLAFDALTVEKSISWNCMEISVIDEERENVERWWWVKRGSAVWDNSVSGWNFFNYGSYISLIILNVKIKNRNLSVAWWKY